MAVEHGGQTAANPALVELHVGLRRKSLEHFLTLCLAESSQVKLVVVAQKVCPLSGSRNPRELAQCFYDRGSLLASQSQKQVLVKDEIEQHVQLGTVPKVLRNLVHGNIRLGEENSIPTPLREEVTDRKDDAVVRIGRLGL